jgi:hypothetical protein
MNLSPPGGETYLPTPKNFSKQVHSGDALLLSLKFSGSHHNIILRLEHHSLLNAKLQSGEEEGEATYFSEDAQTDAATLSQDS